VATEQGYESESSSAFEGSNEQTPPPSEHRPLQESSPPAKPKTKNDVVVKDEEQGIKDLLKDAGLLQFDQADAHSVNGFKFSSRSSFKSYSEKNESDPQFCKDTLMQSRTARSSEAFTQKHVTGVVFASWKTPPNGQKVRVPGSRSSTDLFLITS
jgi:hypothetical protein